MKSKSKQSVEPGLSLECNAARTIRARQEAMFAYAPCLDDPEKVYELHQMRIAAKRLRYTMEIFAEVFSAPAATRKIFTNALDATKSLQEHLGEIHDADVLVPQLTEHLAGMLQPGFGLDCEGEAVVGVHHVDFAACQGLLTLCQENRVGRDRHFQLLLREWQRLQDQGIFAKLDDLLNIREQETVQETPPLEHESTAIHAASSVLPDNETPDLKDAISHAESNSNVVADASAVVSRNTHRARHSDPAGVPSRHPRPRPNTHKGTTKGRI